MNMYEMFNGDYPGSPNDAVNKLNKWVHTYHNNYFYKIVGFTGDPDHGVSILIQYRRK